MATSVQTLPVTRGPTQNFRSPFPSSPLSSLCGMGSVGSLVEKPDVSPTKGNRAVPQVRPRQTNGLLKKGLTQRELLNYLNITRWVSATEQQMPLRDVKLRRLLTSCACQQERAQSRAERRRQEGRHRRPGGG